MSRDEQRRLEAVAAAYFRDTKAAAIAAISEVCTAGTYPEAARAMRAEFGETGISESEAVLLHAIKRGYIWLPFNPVEHGASRCQPLSYH